MVGKNFEVGMGFMRIREVIERCREGFVFRLDWVLVFRSYVVRVGY